MSESERKFPRIRIFPGKKKLSRDFISSKIGINHIFAHFRICSAFERSHLPRWFPYMHINYLCLKLFLMELFRNFKDWNLFRHTSYLKLDKYQTHNITHTRTHTINTYILNVNLSISSMIWVKRKFRTQMLHSQLWKL